MIEVTDVSGYMTLNEDAFHFTKTPPLSLVLGSLLVSTE